MKGSEYVTGEGEWASKDGSFGEPEKQKVGCLADRATVRKSQADAEAGGRMEPPDIVGSLNRTAQSWSFG